MYVKSINNFTFSFRGKIIDAHSHIGYHDNQNLTKDDLDVFIKSSLPNKDKIEQFIVSDIDVLHGKKKEYNGNKELLLQLEKDKHYAVVASCNPKTGNVHEIERLFRDFNGKFVGLKFHHQIQNADLSDPSYNAYYEFADKYKIPCLFHSQVNVDNHEGKLLPELNRHSDPQLIYNIAKKHKDTPFVLAHMGGGWREAHDKAIDVLVSSVKNQDANLYADISWVNIDEGNKNHILKAIKKLKGINNPDWKYGDQSFRLMFGTDSPLARFKESKGNNPVMNYNKFAEEIKTAIRQDKDLQKESEQIIEDLFYNNAKRLYLDNKINVPGITTKGKNKRLMITGSIATICGGIGMLLVFKGKSQQQL